MTGTRIWLDYDKAALDAQYSARGRIANYDSFLPRWIATSAASRSRLRVELDIRYGPTTPETLDVFMPAAPRGPILLFLHGGYWQSLSNKEFEFLAEPFVAAGAVFVAVNYALCPEVTMTTLADQCRDATVFVRRNAARWGADPQQLFVSGHSAGGHLTAWLAAIDWRYVAGDLPPTIVSGGIAISGLYDLEPLRRSYVNDKLRMDVHEARALSPVHHLPATSCPLVAACGGDESPEFQRQQAEFVAAWRSPARPIEMVAAPGHNHFSILDAFCDPAAPLGAATLRLMRLSD